MPMAPGVGFRWLITIGTGPKDHSPQQCCWSQLCTCNKLFSRDTRPMDFNRRRTIIVKMPIWLPGKVHLLTGDDVGDREGVVSRDVLSPWLTDGGVGATVLDEVSVFCVDVDVSPGGVAEGKAGAGARVEHVCAV